MKILLAIDGSKDGGAALKQIIRQPWPEGTEIRVMSVAHPFPVPTIPDLCLTLAAAHMQTLMEEEKRAPRDVEEAAQKIRNNLPGVHVSTTVAEGSPQKLILEEAERWGADLIMLGSHTNGHAQRLFLGSVAQAVASGAPCSVEIVRSKGAP